MKLHKLSEVVIKKQEIPIVKNIKPLMKRLIVLEFLDKLNFSANEVKYNH